MNRTVVDRREQSATEERALGTNRWLVAPGVWRLKDIFVNVFLIQNREGTEWVLVDTGLKTTGAKLKTLVGELFGKSSVPKAIIMTHGHFDHRGSLMELASAWGVPVYCLVAVFYAEVIIFDVNIQVGKYQFIFYKLPDDAGHFIAVQLYNRVGYFNLLCHY